MGSGFSARVYQGPSSEIVISYAGTEFDLNKSGFYNDFISGNVPLALGYDAQQAHRAALLYQRVQARFGAGADISFTGHSLGGGLAGLMAVWFDRPAIVFDPAPFERAATRDVRTPAEEDLGIRLAMPAVLGDLYRLGYNDAKFRDYVPSRDFAGRESRVVSYAIQGEILESIPLLPRIEATRIPKLVGAAPDLSEGDKHSVDLLAAFLLNAAFESAAVAVPAALPVLFDKGLFGLDLLGSDQNLLAKLLSPRI